MSFDFSSWPQLHTVSLVHSVISVTKRRSGEGHDSQER